MSRAFFCAFLALIASCKGETVGSVPSDASTPDGDALGDTFVDWPDGSTVSSGDCGVHPGPKMVRVDTAGDAGARSFCIDATEVTVGQYNQFLRSTNKPKLPPFCGVLDYGAEETTIALQQRPRTSIPWCAAFAYCAWAKKRLCGKLGGGHTKYEDYKYPSESQWSYACRQGPANTGWPYGASYDAPRCVAESGETADVMSKPDCHGQSAPFDQIFDMAGNAGEWEDACDVYERPTGRTCHIRGGWSGAADTSCDEPQTSDVNYVAADLGFRCCLDL